MPESAWNCSFKWKVKIFYLQIRNNVWAIRERRRKRKSEREKFLGPEMKTM
jgi:hypothetical protein